MAKKVCSICGNPLGVDWFRTFIVRSVMLLSLLLIC